jgi:DNA-binding LytR/AlgR family response regulator
MEETRKVLIVEDEFPIALDIETRLIKLGYEVCGTAVNYMEAIVMLAEKEYDIVLLDINLEEKKSGIDLGIIINEKFHRPIIFITAYSDTNTFNQAIKANPMGYLTKPFNDGDLNRNIVMALQNFKNYNYEQYGENKLEQKSTDQLFIREKGIIRKINIEDILWAEAMENYSIIYTSAGKHVINSFLKDVIEKLDGYLFRTHRSYAVAINKITTIEDNTVYLGKSHLPLTYSYKSDLLKKMKLL